MWQKNTNRGSIHKQALMTLGASALAAFAVLYGGNAWANTVYTVPGQSCGPYANVGRICPIAGGAPLSNGLSAVYFDFKSSGANKVITSTVWRQTPQGTIVIANDVDILSSGVHETSVSCGDLNPNRSVWDYYFAAVSGENVGLSVYGIGVWAL